MADRGGPGSPGADVTLGRYAIKKKKPTDKEMKKYGVCYGLN